MDRQGNLETYRSSYKTIDWLVHSQINLIGTLDGPYLDGQQLLCYVQGSHIITSIVILICLGIACLKNSSGSRKTVIPDVLGKLSYLDLLMGHLRFPICVYAAKQRTVMNVV
jgi:hypothetical protein